MWRLVRANCLPVRIFFCFWQTPLKRKEWTKRHLSVSLANWTQMSWFFVFFCTAQTNFPNAAKNWKSADELIERHHHCHRKVVSKAIQTGVNAWRHTQSRWKGYQIFLKWMSFCIELPYGSKTIWTCPSIEHKVTGILSWRQSPSENCDYEKTFTLKGNSIT